MRLNKYLAETGACSRRGADQWIEAGRVAVNGARAVLGTQINEGDEVRVDGQALVANLDQAGIYCSQSSACTNQRPEPSYVLRAMGLSEEEAYSAVRFSFSELNTPADALDAANIVIGTVKRLRGFEGAGAFAA